MIVGPDDGDIGSYGREDGQKRLLPNFDRIKERNRMESCYLQYLTVASQLGLL
ncbi:MAG: hypothetical protein J7K13_00950 [Thermoplasmata archaeon]|nr:hypothetical protein [Thermoplasmata archaeon]